MKGYFSYGASTKGPVAELCLAWNILSVLCMYEEISFRPAALLNLFPSWSSITIASFGFGYPFSGVNFTNDSDCPNGFVDCIPFLMFTLLNLLSV